MNFILIDSYKTTIDKSNFLVVVLYEKDSHVTSKVYFKYSEKDEERINIFVSENIYTNITPYIQYKMNSNGKVSLKLSI